MSGLFGNKSNQVAFYSGLQVSTTTASAPIPILWGRNMIAGTVINYQNFRSETVTASGKQVGGGIGGFIKGAVGGGTEKVYYADILMLFCVGPIADVVEVYQNGWTPYTLTEVGLADLHVGTIGQAADSWWATTYPDQCARLFRPRLFDRRQFRPRPIGLGRLDVVRDRRRAGRHRLQRRRRRSRPDDPGFHQQFLLRRRAAAVARRRLAGRRLRLRQRAGLLPRPRALLSARR